MSQPEWTYTSVVEEETGKDSSTGDVYVEAPILLQKIAKYV